jgi:predicted ArsR family transcriptional regulator
MTCPQLARELGMTTQKVNYHMNVLKEAGLVNLVEERRKRGTVEGVYRAVARSFWFSPRLVAQLGGRERTKDQASLAYLLQLAEDLQIDVGQMLERENADAIPSLGVDARIQLRYKEDRARFLTEVKEIFTRLAEKYGCSGKDSPNEGESYRLMLACYNLSKRE